MMVVERLEKRTNQMDATNKQMKRKAKKNMDRRYKI